VSVRAGTGPEFDVVVVGAGAAGSVVSRRLAEAGRSVLLLEAGPDLRRETPTSFRDGWTLPTIPDWGFATEPDADGATQRLRRGRLVGGTSWLTRFAVRGGAADFDAWAARGIPGWTFDEVLPAFRRIETDADFGSESWHGADGPVPITRYPDIQPTDIHQAAIRGLEGLGFAPIADHNAPAAVGVGRMPMSSMAGRRVTASEAFLPVDLVEPTLTIRAGGQVASVVIEAGRACGVRLVDGSAIPARWVVLAAGTYGSPAILMRSGIGPAAHLRELGVAVVCDLPGVGSNLADHPTVSVDTGWRGEAVNGATLHTLATMRSSHARADAAPDLAIWIADPAGDEPSFEIDALLMKPDSRGSVRLRSSDPTAPPRISLPGIRAARDIDRLVEAHRICQDLANRPEIRRIASGPAPVRAASAEELRRTVVADASSVPHVVGTCRMGPGEDDVVDELGRVHGLAALSVIDASIIPEATAGFPHLVTIMLADRLGRLTNDLL
jgi:choline dehydrogenase-like flavoprotein